MNRDLLVPVLATAALTAAIAAVALVMPPADSAAIGPVRQAPPAPSADKQAALKPPPRPVRRSTLGRRGTLGGALDRFDLSPDLRARYIGAISGRIDVRRLSPRTGVSLVDGDGPVPHALAIRTAEDRFLRVLFDVANPAAEPRAEWVDLPVVTRIDIAGGVVSRSVAQALSSSDHGHLLPHAFADVVQWDVDLLVDPRPGDEVRVAFETRWLDDVPYDTPPYGGEVGEAGQFLGLGKIVAASYAGQIASAEAYWVDRDENAGDYYDPDGQPLRKTFLKSPLNYRRISSGFSHARRNPVTRKVVPHHGVDFAAASGTPVAATADGKVISAGWAGALGRAVKIRHGSEHVTIYGHLSRIAKGIRPGTEVRQGHLIGYVGSTGRATGPHLHYSMIVGGSPVNPLRFVNPPAHPLEVEFRPALDAAIRSWKPVLESIDVSARVDLARGNDDSATRPPGS